MNHARRKALGAYYTSRPVAEFLANWAIRGAEELVLDPSCGDGALLRAAAKRLRQLGGVPQRVLYGVEKDRTTHRKLVGALTAEGVAEGSRLLHGDFFRLRNGRAPKVQVVLANPPFIRYQNFNGSDRERALSCARAFGLELSERASSWAPFVVQACSYLRPNGRAAMVLPTEVLHAAYARPVVDYLLERFRKVAFVAFEEPLFPELEQDAILLLASGHMAEASKGGHIYDLTSESELKDFEQLRRQRPLSLGLGRAEESLARVSESLLPAKTAALYRKLSTDPRCERLGELARLTIGYVTGGNRFFHLSRAELRELGLSSRSATKVVRRAKQIPGALFSSRDWAGLDVKNEPVWLFSPTQSDVRKATVKDFLAHGKELGVHLRTKCAGRDPWWSVPIPPAPDAFLTPVSDALPRLVLNRPRVPGSNSLLVLWVKEVELVALVASFYSSLTALSAEIEGHTLGGGGLKLEPGEARRLVLAGPGRWGTTSDAFDFLTSVDRCLRRGDVLGAIELGDRQLLQDRMAISERQVSMLRSGWIRLRDRRLKRK